MTSMNELPRRCGVVACEHKGALVDLELELFFRMPEFQTALNVKAARKPRCSCRHT